MTSSRFSGYLGSEYDSFLTSPLWLDRNNSPLSVMSALARLDLDPWSEAAALAALSKAAAVTRLSALLGPLPGAPSTKPDREGLCQRALGLLPAQYAVTTRLPALGLPTVPKTGIMARQTSSSLLFLGWIVIAGLIGASVLPRLIDRPATTTATHFGSAPVVHGFTPR
jgi:hypothetical protein